jgi:hypothetical protein
MDIYSGDLIWVKVQLLGRVSDLMDLLPADELRDEVYLSFVPLPCYTAVVMKVKLRTRVRVKVNGEGSR